MVDTFVKFREPVTRFKHKLDNKLLVAEVQGHKTERNIQQYGYIDITDLEYGTNVYSLDKQQAKSLFNKTFIRKKED